MGQRNHIGMESVDGSISYIYCQWGAPPGENGSVLLDHYATPERVRALLALGSLSSLQPRIAPEDGEAHSYDAPARGVTVAYHRDRGEELDGPTAATDRDALLGQEWAYLFVEQTGEWLARRGDEDDTWQPVADRLGEPFDPASDPGLLELQAKLAALTRPKRGERSAAEREAWLADRAARLERLERTAERGEKLFAERRDAIEVVVPTDRAEALKAELTGLGLEATRETLDGRTTFSIPRASDREETRRAQATATLAAARVAAGGTRVQVHGLSLPREVELLGDQVVATGTGTLDVSTHKTVLRNLAAYCPDVPHPLVPRDVARAREDQSSTSRVTSPAPRAAISIGEVRFGPRRDETRIEVDLRFSEPGLQPVRVEHLGRDADGNPLGWERREQVVEGGQRYRSRVATQVYFPRLVDRATSELRVQTFVQRAALASPEQPVEDGPVGSRERCETDGMVLEEWMLSSGGEGKFEGVARFTTASDGWMTASVRRHSHGTLVDEEAEWVGWLRAGETGTVVLRIRRVEKGDTLSVEIRAHEPGPVHTLAVEHAL